MKRMKYVKSPDRGKGLLQRIAIAWWASFSLCFIQLFQAQQWANQLNLPLKVDGA